MQANKTGADGKRRSGQGPVCLFPESQGLFAVAHRRGVTSSTQAPYPSPCPGGRVSLIALRLLPPPDPLRWARAGTPLALLHLLPRVREGVGTFLAPTRKVPKRMGSARAVMSSGVRRERRGKPDGSLRGPGRVFPQSYGLDRVAHRRGVTSGIRGSTPLCIPPARWDGFFYPPALVNFVVSNR